MKFTLGKIALFLLTALTLIAQENLVSYSLKASKLTAYVKEPITITFTAHQKDHTDHMFYSLEPKASKDYEITLLHKESSDLHYHDSTATYTYLLFAKKAKQLNVAFRFVVHTASDKAIKQSYVDDHDDSIAISTQDSVINLKPLHLNITQLDQKVDLVGDFTLTSSIDTKSITEYEDINLHYSLEGVGYPADRIKLFHMEDKALKLFTHVSDRENRATKRGFIIKKEFTYAITSKKSFSIAPVALKAYSLKHHNYYTLTTQGYNIDVKTIDLTKLVDREDSPLYTTIDFALYKNILIGIILFLAGFISAKLSQNLHFNKKESPFQDILDAKTPQALLLILLNRYSNRETQKYIDTIEKMQRKQGSSNMSLEKLKKKILQEFT